MLVWLASYPRSGNTLLRQVLKACFDLNSCEGLEPVPADFRTPDGIRDRFYGSYFVEGDAEAFYRRARAAPELVPVKSHQMPRDAERAIYVVRDGRLAVRSFVRFNEAYHPGSGSFESLVVGDCPYGEWTSHYRAWCERERGETLVIRFEELVNADAALLARLAAFLGVPGPQRPWVNPQGQLRELDPAFFGPGATAWRPDAFWTAGRLRQFYTLHGRLLVECGYASPAEVAAGAYPACSDEERLLRVVRAVVTSRDALQRACAERADALARTARAEKRDGTAALAEACAARDRLLAELTLTYERRLDGAHRQLEAAGARLCELNRHCLRLERRLWWRRLPLFGALRRFLPAAAA